MRRWPNSTRGFLRFTRRSGVRPRSAPVFVFAIAAYNIVRLPKLLAQRAKCVRRLEEGDEPRPKTSFAGSTIFRRKISRPTPSARKRSGFLSSLLVWRTMPRPAVDDFDLVDPRYVERLTAVPAVGREKL